MAPKQDSTSNKAILLSLIMTINLALTTIFNILLTMWEYKTWAMANDGHFSLISGARLVYTMMVVVVAEQRHARNR